MAPEPRLRQSGSRAGPLTTTLPPLKHNLKWLRRGMCPESSPPRPPTGTRADRQHSRSPGVALSHNPERELLSIYEVTKALRFTKKHKPAQVCLTDGWWLSQHACMPCVQFGGSLMEHTSEEAPWLRGPLTELCCTPRGAGARVLCLPGSALQNSQGLALCLFAGGCANTLPGPAGS